MVCDLVYLCDSYVSSHMLVLHSGLLAAYVGLPDWGYAQVLKQSIIPK